MKRIAIATIIVLLGVVGGFVFFSGSRPGPTVQDAVPGAVTPTEQTPRLPDDAIGTGRAGQAEQPSPEPVNGVESEPAYRILEATTIEGAAPQFRYAADIPTGWRTEAIGAIEAINIYAPETPGLTNLEKSQIFVRYFTANSFLTLSTVTIFEQESLTVANRPAVRYLIEKKAGVADFPNQPLWRNQKHTVTDVRESDSNPSVFYVIAKHPDLDQEIYERFLATLQVGP